MKKLLTLFVLICPLLALAQQTRQITGQVLDRADGTPLVGATVFIAPEETQAKNYNPQGTIVYEQGRFAFKLPVSVKKVVVSYLGYEAQTIDISGKSNFTIYLSATESKMDAVVVTGYQRIEKRKLTSSIANVKMADIARDGVASVDEMLSGSIAGLTSTPTTGAPGGASKVKIRSTVTLNGNTDPLWVLDGMPLEGNDIPSDWSSKENVDNLYNMSIAGLNPADIEDITVLKDAAATAIYGARAANGVIIITTKKGRRNQATRVNVSASLFVTDRPNLDKLNLMNASQKVDLELALAANGRLNYLSGMGGVARILDQAGERAALVGGGFSAISPETQSAINALRKNGTDWGKEIYQVALNQQYSISISGGGNKASYYFSGGYYNEQGTTVGTGFERLNLTLKTDYDLLKNLRFGTSVFVGQNKNDSYVSDTDVFTNPSRYTRTVNPYLNAYNPDGSYLYDPDMTARQRDSDVLDYNYFEERNNTEYTLKTRSIKTIFDLDYQPVKGLRLYTQFGLQVDNSMTEKMAQENSYFTRKYARNSVVDGVRYMPEGGVIQNWNSDMSQYNWKAQIEYSGTFAKKHELDLMAGMEMRGTTNTTIHTKGFGYDHKTMVTEPMPIPSGDAGERLANSSYFKQYQKSFYENRYLSYFFTGSYTYDNRYTIFGSMRYDGTNLFGVDPKYKFNPMWSISGAWSVNREKFLRDAKWLDNLRLRASYGAQGNIDRSTSPYILGTWTTRNVGGSFEDAIFVSSPPNQNLRWETTYTWNAALDFAALENRIGFTFEIYGRNSKNLITTRTIPQETGFTSTSSNFGEMSSKGIEFTLNTVNVRTRDFSWETSINIAHNTDRVDKVHIDENSYTPSKEGYSSSAVFAYKTAGLDEYGIPMFWKDGQKVSLREFTDFRLDKTDYGFFVLYDPQVSTSQSAIRNNLSYIGSQNPNITGGFNNRFYYKNFDLSVSCNFVFGQLVKRTPFYSPTQTSPGENNTTEIGQVWSPENTSGIYPALTGNLKPDGTTWSGWDEWEANPDPYYLYNWILEQYNSISGASLFDNLDIWYKKINYFRVNSIRLGYAFPEKITRKLHMAGLRIHFEARNPFVIASNYDGYFDPETYGSIYSQPMARTYSVGLNITF
ncbi:SusC/RagA family TonB-linked outer membrane protein [Alistipes senegalensis]|uniref:SusC/RagA family TonB-linked outer membrane protein n=1 Tax=Alistipes senegalensis TaxID=1288121 RepID=UPI00242B54E8|nr:SusC/RagA family TonB-linked outer membrane protein [Alistipes senegalensis]MCI7308248.1 SusC/RagA family TonB-linked outer membrane protein [Alistipes senegalensis]MDD7039261.1 SusC/RagA family TonB-linked outer membrane protein [Alistipes senegalensis]MDY2876398.1 SusC/RagA family TonB-linked outer membrane protein [Alistipes senegalensis]MDY5241688.1 SusC/RagA family TonB-linked outer membrane protein [Alistipes senegalensis]